MWQLLRIEKLPKYAVFKRNSFILHHNNALLQTLKHLLKFFLECPYHLNFILSFVGFNNYLEVEVVETLVDVDEKGGADDDYDHVQENS